MNTSKNDVIRTTLTLPCPELFHSKEHTEETLTIHVEGRESALSMIAELPDRGLCWVGSRKPLDLSRKRVRTWTKQLAHSVYHPPIMISGLALGIDGEVHEAALASGLRTIAFVGHGLNHQYPYAHRSLRKRIVDSGGLVISEYEPDVKPFPAYFIRRNRLMAFFSRAICVIEASRKSGSLWTAKYARDFGRECFAVPCSPDDPRFGGNQHVLDMEGAIPMWGVHSLGRLWTELMTVRPDGEKVPTLSPEENETLSGIRKLFREMGGASTEALLAEMGDRGRTPPEVFKLLQTLQNKAVIREERGLWRPQL